MMSWRAVATVQIMVGRIAGTEGGDDTRQLARLTDAMVVDKWYCRCRW